ncbi:hypothetical protein [Fischerella sp. JS2]|uniref:hypothetical protein n=1 Tax=Fischerella sp. JS2 TaxID=2597771 RepID=UPI0028E7E51B|nr:hypothetical protein [Fischerella sp. JS2]
MELFKVLNQPHWNYFFTHEGITIKAPSKQAATQLAMMYRECLTETAYNIKGKVKIAWRCCKSPIQIFSWMALEQSPTPYETAEAILRTDGEVLCSLLHLPVPLLKQIVQAGESERPVSIVRCSDRKQIIINKPMEMALQTPAIESTQRIMTRFWRLSDLETLERELQLTNRFRWQYNAALNPRTWAILESEFERFEVNGQWYSQTTFLIDPEPIAFPHDDVILDFDRTDN